MFEGDFYLRIFLVRGFLGLRFRKEGLGSFGVVINGGYGLIYCFMCLLRALPIIRSVFDDGKSFCDYRDCFQFLAILLIIK